MATIPARIDPAAAASAEGLATLAKALGHPARLRIVDLLLRQPGCVGHDIVDELGLAQSTTSEHLRILRDAGIIKGRIERPRVCYSLDPAALEPLRLFLNLACAATPGAACSPEGEC